MVHVQELDLFVTVMLLEETPANLSLGKLCEDHGYTYYWRPAVKNHISQKMARISIAIFRTTYNSFSTSSSQDSEFDVSRFTENPVPERSGRMSEELRGNPAAKTSRN